MVNNGQEDYINLDDESYLNYTFVNENNGGENIEGESDVVEDNCVKNIEGESAVVEDNCVKNIEGESDVVEDNCVKNIQGKSDTVGDGYKKITELTAEDIRGLEFASELEACEFYRMHAKCVGFVTRKDDIHRDVKGNIIMRQLVCNREGLRNKKHYMRVDRIREHKPITRTNCPARFRVHLDCKTSIWKVVAFEESHNHELTPTQCNDLVPVNRSARNADKVQIDNIHIYGVRTHHIMGLMLGQKGGHSELGFCMKNLYNHLDKPEQAKLQDSDAFAALCYLQAKADNDPMFFCKFTTTTDGKLQHLFWVDGASRLDYECFGDIVAFDTTYKKNDYNKPLVIFGGYNHHGEIVIFGCALVADERIETYKWVLKAFTEAMFDKHPNAVVTDGDCAMREAIRDVFPNASHRLCSWHLHQDAVENIKNVEFVEDFKFLIYSNLTPDEFECQWKKVIDKYGVANNKWVNKVYEMKTIWASAFMRDEFFAGIRSTLLFEGTDLFIKRYAQSKSSSIVDFLHNFECAVKEYRHNELTSDLGSIYSEPIMTTALYEIEAEASKIFTRNKFKEVKSEIESSAALNVVEHSEYNNSVRLKINKFCSPNIEYLVVYDKIDNRFQCDCRMFECCGIPCCHVFCAMKFLHMDVVPSTSICKRWTKSAKIDYIASISAEKAGSQKMMLQKVALATACYRLSYLAAKRLDDFLEISEDIYKLTVKIEKRSDPTCKQRTSSMVIGNHTVIKAKGVPHNKQFSHSKKTGHTFRNCPQLLPQDGLCSIDEEVSPSNCDGDTISPTNIDVSLDQSCSRHTASIQVSKGKIPDYSGAGVLKRKRSNEKSSIQNSVKDNNDATKGDGYKVILPMYPTKRSAMYPQYPGIPLYPTYPGMYPQSHCFGLYPPPPFVGFLRKEQHTKKNP